MKYNLDKLKKVDLRDVWPHEALDFTKWLSEEPNLAMLKGCREFLEAGVCAADLAGDETSWPMKQFRELFREAKKLDYP